MADRLPRMFDIGKRYVNAVTNSADAERSFSLYNIILTCRRRSLTEEQLKYMCFLYYNQRVKNNSSESEETATEPLLAELNFLEY